MNRPHDSLTPGRPVDTRTFLVTGAVPDAIARAAAAFLNTDGGRIVIGVTPEGRVVGTDEYLAESLQEDLHFRVSPHVSIPIATRQVAGKLVLFMDVPRGFEQPYVVEDHIYVWHAGTVEPATPGEISDMIIGRAEQGRRWEREPALGVSLSDLDEREIYLTMENASRRSVSGSSYWDSVLDYIESLNLAADDHLSKGAVVLFGRNPSRMFPQTRLRLAAFADMNRTEFLDNKVVEGHLFELFESATKFVDRHTSVQSSFRDMSRNDVSNVPRFVLREAVMNALVHRDYHRADANVTLSLYPDRFEVWNPGQLPEGLTPMNLALSRVSRPRNPDIANVAFIRGLIEQWGSGTGRMLIECQRAGLPSPEWSEVGGGVRVTILLRRVREPYSALSLERRLVRFLRDSYPGQKVSLEEYVREYASEASESVAQEDLARLAREGYLERVPSVAGPLYVRTDTPGPLS